MENTNIQPLTEQDIQTQDTHGGVAAYDQLTPQEQAKVDAIAASVDITDSAAVLQYGVQAQSDVAYFADSILKKLRTKDSGYVGEILSDLMTDVKKMDVDKMTGEKSVFDFLGHMKRKAKKLMTQYDKVGGQIDKTVMALDKSRIQLLKDISLLDNLYETNLTYHKELTYYVLAGEKKIQDIKSDTLPEMTAKAQASGSPEDAQKVRDYGQLLTRFEKKVHDLKLSKTVALQTGPQVRLIQSSDQVLVEKIQSAILNTIPLWKNQIVIAISLLRQGEALKQQQEVSRITNELLTKNAQRLKENTTETARASEQGIVEIETLKQVNRDLIDTIEETLLIQKDGRAKRAEAEEALRVMEIQLKETLVGMN